MEYLIIPLESVSTVSVITKVTYLLFLLLILAIFVERTVEIFMSILKYLDIKLGWYRFWNKQAEKYRDRLDRLYGLQGSNTEDKKLLYKWILWNVVSEEPNIGGKAVIAAKAIRTRYYRIISRIFAFVLSLIFSIWVYRLLELDLVEILENIGGFQISLSEAFWPWLKIVITAAILAAGAEPLHQLINRVEKGGKKRKTSRS